MTAEFAFLALGLLIGVPVGMALLLRFRSRPRAAREVRLTVTPDSVPRRRSATLATDPFSTDKGSARGGPADTAWYTDHAASRTPVPGRVAPATVSESPSTDPLMAMASPGEPPARDATPRPVLRTGVRASVGVSVGRGVDPMLAAIQAGPAADKVAVGVPAGAPAAPMTVEAATIDRLRTVIADDSSRRRAAMEDYRAANDRRALADRRAASVAGQVGPQSSASPGPSAVSQPSAVRQSSVGIAPPAGSSSVVASSPVVASSSTSSRSDGAIRATASDDFTATSAAEPPAGSAVEPPAATGSDKPTGAPCDDERHAVDERCGLADRMKTQADQAAAKLRETQREYDAHVSMTEQAGAAADPRAQRAAKDVAQRSFRTNRAAAGTREAVEAAARTWLQEINRINAEAREASATLVAERAAAAPLLVAIERLTVQADSARVQAESAQESCIVAREALANCEEAQRPTTARLPLEPSLGPGEMPSGRPIPSWAESAAPILGGPVAPEVVDEGALLGGVALGGQPAIFRLLAGDHAAMQQIVADVAGDDADERRRWQLLLADFVDAVVARAIEACAFEFPTESAFWAPFSRSQARDIALALSSLGYRFDGLGGFAEERIPSQRDLSLAVGYAGLDPMRVRRWPNEAEMAALFANVTVSSDEYLSAAASGLTLGELVSLLGPRADPLTDLWNAWGQVRPLLLEPSERPSRH